MYTIAHYHSFGEHGVRELWLRFATGQKTRNIPLHVIAQEMGLYKRHYTLLKAYVLTDYTTKIGTKYAAVNVHPERHLDNFRTSDSTSADYKLAEKYLVQFSQMKIKCKTNASSFKTMNICLNIKQSLNCLQHHIQYTTIFYVVITSICV